MRDDYEFPRPAADCTHFLPGTPAAVPMPNGWICGGMAGQPCQSCVRMALGVRGQAEILARLMGYEPEGDADGGRLGEGGQRGR